MPPTVIAAVLLAAYLLGAIPFGYLIGRARGVDLFKAGSGNIGATNTGRVLGRRFGVLVFVLDFLKGAIPVALIGEPEWLRVCAAALAFLGHLFPVYLGFRGGKGVATGAGTVFVLVPGPAAAAVLSWVVVLLVTRLVSLASLLAVVALVLARLFATPTAFSPVALPVTLYLIAGAAMVGVKHRANRRRLAAGTESRIGDFTMRPTLVRGLHVLALGFWFGGAGFFNFVTAPAIFDSFKEVVNAGPSDRTAYQSISAPDTDKGALASALAGSAVGPVFPRYFAMQAVCGLVAFVTALGWWNAGGKVHRWRVYVIGVALLVVSIAWPLSNHVSELRLLRFDPNPDIAKAAKEDFVPWHLLSLLLSFVTVVLAGIALALAAKLPGGEKASPPTAVGEY